MSAGCRALLVLAAISVATSTRVFAAEPTSADRETSRSLYSDGMSALETRAFERAERSCRGAYALVKAPTAAVCFARALEGLGRLIEARDIYLEAARSPIATTEPPIFATSRDTARVEAGKLQSRIPTVLLVVSGPDEAASLGVTIDGTPVAPDTVRLPRKLDPGLHAIVVTSPGFQAARLEATLADAEVKRISVDLKREGTVVSASAPSNNHSLAYVAFGVGGVGLIVGVVTGIVAGSKHSTLAGECDNTSNTCAPTYENDLDSFHTWRTVSTIGYVIGAAGLVGGAVLWFTASPTTRPANAARAGLWFGPASAGIVGSF